MDANNDYAWFRIHRGQHIVLDLGRTVGEVVFREIEPDEACIEHKGRKYGSVVLYNNPNSEEVSPVRNEDRLETS